MGGDYTRFTFDPTKGFSGVLKQQGRVSLDSDANELEAILDRRDRAEMYDTVGKAVYPLTTPNGFKIGVDLGGKVTIGQGRMYVDGILVECFGDMTAPAANVFDAQMNDLVGPNPLLYDQQPFLYTTPAFPKISPTAGDVNLVYLDVWQREVTVFEDPSLREIALNGPDTDTRVQTAWQVKSIIDPSATPTCLMPPSSWGVLTAPSTARLTAAATAAPPTPGPCVISPAGGYIGLENRLYRVEVQTAGTVGGATPATFKWSRDNASLGARVVSSTKVTATDWILTLASTGRDSWMRFEFGNHVELLDDDVEFAMRESGKGGLMARITSVNHATGEIHVDQDLTTFPIVAGRHPRIRRWDVANAAEPLARNTIVGAAIPLESGISVTFGAAAADTLHAGDYWVFAARTADGTIDTVVEQPPRNTLHHYTPLALVTSGAPPAVLTDCRIPWPPKEGCCTVVVQVGEDIQTAINKLNGIGGCVCLKMGVHHIRAPLTILQDNVTMHGEVPWVTVVLDAGGPEMLRISGVRNVSIEGILFVAPGGEIPRAVITLERVRGGHIVECGVRVTVASGDSPRALGIELTTVHDYEVDTVQMFELARGVLGRNSTEVSVIDCAFIGPKLILPSGGAVLSLGLMGVQFAGDDLAGLYVERNTLTDYQRGIQLGDITAAAILPSGGFGRPVDISNTQGGCRVVANTITRHVGPRGAGGGGGIGAIAFAIAAHIARCDITENAMNIAAYDQYGVLVAGGNVTFGRNEVRSNVPFDFKNPTRRVPIGIAVVEALNDALICSIRENVFTGMQQAIAVTGVGSGGEHRVDIVDNRIIGDEGLRAAASAGLLVTPGGNAFVKLLGALDLVSAIALGDLSRCRVEGNQIDTSVCGVFAQFTLATDIARNRVNSSLFGAVCVAVAAADVSDNVVDSGLSSVLSLGVGVFFSLRSVIARNVISHCVEGILTGFTGGIRLQDNNIYEVGAGVFSIIDADLEVRGNTIEDAVGIGIVSLFSLHELTIAHNHVRRVGYQAGTPTASGYGILAVLALALVTVDGCHVIDTGDSPNPSVPLFTGRRHGIVVLFAIGVRVRGCEIASKPLGRPPTGGATAVNNASRPLRIWTLPPGLINKLMGFADLIVIPFADATDNVIEQSALVLVEIVSFGEVMLATNRCVNFDRQKVPSVMTIGTVTTVTGNRVRGGGSIPQMAMVFQEALSAVGNASSKGGSVFPTAPGLPQAPAPFAAFNVTTT